MNSIASTVDGAAEQVKDTAASARGGFIELGTQVLAFVNAVRSLELRGVRSLLDRVGLQRRESALRPVIWFASGAVIGGSAALLLAPMSGKELRNRASKMAAVALTRATDGVKRAAEQVEGAASNASHAVAAAVSARGVPVGTKVADAANRPSANHLPSA